MREIDVTDYLAPYRPRRVRRPVRLRLTDDTYPLEPTPKESWLPIAFRAFARLAGRISVRDALIVGTGNGLDALGAAEIRELIDKENRGAALASGHAGLPSGCGAWSPSPDVSAGWPGESCARRQATARIAR